MVLITLVTGANLNQLITGGPHVVEMVGGFPVSPMAGHILVSWVWQDL